MQFSSRQEYKSTRIEMCDGGWVGGCMGYSAWGAFKEESQKQGKKRFPYFI